MRNQELSLDQRNQVDLINAFASSEMIIKKNHLSILDQLEIIDVPETINNIKIEESSRFFKINKLIYDKDESYLDKLTNVFSAAAISKCSVATIIKNDGEKFEYYLGMVNKIQGMDLTTNYETLVGTFEGNFPGSSIKKLNNDEIRRLTSDIFSDFEEKIVSSVSGIPASKMNENKNIINYIQGLEKLSDSIKELPCTILLLADPISSLEMDQIRMGYESLHSELSPFLKTEISFNESDNITITDGVSNSLTNTISNSIARTQSNAETSGWSNSETKGTSKNRNMGNVAGGTAMTITTLLAGKFATEAVEEKAVAEMTGKAAKLVIKGVGSLFGPVGAFVGEKAGTVVGEVIGQTGALVASKLLIKSATTTGLGVSASKVLEGGIGSSTKSESKTEGESGSNTTSTGETKTQGTSESKTTQTSKATSEGTTRGRNLQISVENRAVRTLLDKIDTHIERIKTCEDYGMFNFATYFISDFPSTNKLASSAYSSLIKGKDSSIEAAQVNTWYDQEQNKKLIGYLKKMSHPTFDMSFDEINKVLVTPASLINSKELGIGMLFPKKSISGLSVVESIGFGRNVINISNSERRGNLQLGKLYHMGKSENIEVSLDKKSLSMHTFITGSTGSGKSNTIYKMLKGLGQQRVKFLVIEPAKGEYKHVFGNEKNVTVLGTNPYKTDLLKINPFKFPEDIHVLEHIDRLIEIFNVCWPMYAAMPAVLKSAVEKSYISSGWDLDISVNKYSNDVFPTFIDVLEHLKNVVDESDFSDEVKGNYKGALITRIESLTNGINGRILSNNDEIDNDILFDQNVIVDLSRVGSVETKSLIMGILVMRLQEHRMSQGGMNQNLKHITVLEEAHNLLKRTSTEQSSEGSNLLGKSVEMLSNAIAEMRTYGEGFIIADQSPGLLDMSAIRNTNTKIILRLPDFSDRELVGKAVSLSDDQIREVSKLETGVGVVYQNDWLEPVLCKIDKMDLEEIEYEKCLSKNELFDYSKYKSKLIEFLIHERLSDKVEFDIDYLEDNLKQIQISTRYKIAVSELIKNYKNTNTLGFSDSNNFNILSDIIFKLSDAEKELNLNINKSKNIDQLNQNMFRHMENTIGIFDDELKLNIMHCLMNKLSVADSENLELYANWVKTVRGEVSVC